MNAMEHKEMYILETPVVQNLSESFHFDNPVVPFHFAEEIVIPEPVQKINIVNPVNSTINIENTMGKKPKASFHLIFSFYNDNRSCQYND